MLVSIWPPLDYSLSGVAAFPFPTNQLMDYYRVKDGQTLLGMDDEVLGADGAVVALATDAKDKTKRHEAEGILMGQWSRVTKVDKPAKKASKKATYKTKDATPEG